MKTLQLLLSTVLVYALAIGICCAAEHESGLKRTDCVQSDRDGNVEVFRINADGSNPVQITHTDPEAKISQSVTTARRILPMAQKSFSTGAGKIHRHPLCDGCQWKEPCAAYESR